MCITIKVVEIGKKIIKCASYHGYRSRYEYVVFSSDLGKAQWVIRVDYKHVCGRCRLWPVWLPKSADGLMVAMLAFLRGYMSRFSLVNRFPVFQVSWSHVDWGTEDKLD